MANEWAEAVKSRLTRVEPIFHQSPDGWKNDINLFRLGVLCEYLECEVGIEYNEEQRNAKSIKYTNPSDLFLNGVMDTRQGTCANMAALHVALGRRLGWPVSLACVNSHFICRYDDGEVTHNIEATQSGYGGFKTDPDEYLIEENSLPPIAISSGSDLRALAPREELGVLLGLRGRHQRDVGKYHESELSYLLARNLYPTSRRLYLDSMAVTIRRSESLFDPNELGSPLSLCDYILSEYAHLDRMPTHDGEPVLGIIYEPIGKE